MTIGVDFDGVLHRYSDGWRGGEIYDPPVEGAEVGLRALMETDAVFVFTARCDLHAVAEWIGRHFSIPVFVEHGTTTNFWNERNVLLVTNRKLPARIYVDDRAVRFKTWRQTLDDIADLGE